MLPPRPAPPPTPRPTQNPRDPPGHANSTAFLLSPEHTSLGPSTKRACRWSSPSWNRRRAESGAQAKTHANTAQIRQSERVAAFGGLVWLLKQDTCCPFASVVLAGRPAWEQTSQLRREQGENAAPAFFVCHLSVLQPPSGSAASWGGGEREREDGGKLGLSISSWALVIITSPYITFSRDTEGY